MPKISNGLDLIEPAALARSMRAAGHTVRSLASAVDVHRAMIGKLRSGSQVRCRTRVAWAIEKELGVPAGELFSAPEVSRVSCKCARHKSEVREVPAA